MNVTLLYTRVVRKWDQKHPEHKSYEESTGRFIKTYLKYKPPIPHRLVVVNCGGVPKSNEFDGIASDYTYYNGGGYDCGTWQAIGKLMDCDLVFCLNTHTYFWRDGWLEPFIEANRLFGPGVYGATASLERNPHLRTPCIAFHPDVVRRYPLCINSRNMAVQFESGETSLTLWAQSAGYPVKLVAADGIYGISNWRVPPNIFRRGDQSNCLVWDRHTDIYAAADPDKKRMLERQADTGS